MKPKTMVIAIGILIAFCAGIFFYPEWQKARFDASLPQPPAPTEVQSETETNDRQTKGGHWHGDEGHAEPHTPATFAAPIDEVTPIGDYTVSATATQHVPYIPSENPALAELYQMLNADTPEGADLRNSPFGVYLLEQEAWQREEATLYAEEAAWYQEEEELGLNDFDAFIKNLDLLSAEEREALVEKMKALQQKWEALAEKKRAHRAARPIEPPHGREQ